MVGASANWCSHCALRRLVILVWLETLLWLWKEVVYPDDLKFEHMLNQVILMGILNQLWWSRTSREHLFRNQCCSTIGLQGVMIPSVICTFLMATHDEFISSSKQLANANGSTRGTRSTRGGLNAPCARNGCALPCNHTYHHEWFMLWLNNWHRWSQEESTRHRRALARANHDLRFIWAVDRLKKIGGNLGVPKKDLSASNGSFTIRSFGALWTPAAMLMVT